MIQSMTGYGRGEYSNGNCSAVIELRAVNHRYFELSVKAPRSCGFIDDKVKGVLQQRIARGKVDAFVTFTNESDDGSVVEINRSLMNGYCAAMRSIADECGLDSSFSADTIARFPDVLTVKKQQLDEDEVWQTLCPALNAALDEFVTMRHIEGEKLKSDIMSRLQFILDKVSFVEQRSPQTVQSYRERLEARIKELLGSAEVDEQRLLTETAVFADKIAVAEETVRLRSHIDQMTALLSSDEAIGRKLDFLVQEMNRETQTIGSKAQDIEIAHTVVDIKAEIEKIREQIQNIE